MSRTRLMLTLYASFFVSSALAGTDFLVIADPHLNINQPTTTFYSIIQDAGLDLWKASLGAMKTSIKQHPVKFAILLGDLPAHHLREPTKSDSEQRILTDLRITLGKLPIIYIPGNNDSIGGNYHSYTITSSANNYHRPDQLDKSGNWPAQGMKKCTSSTTSACIVDTGPSDATPYFYGSYAVYPLKQHDLRLIALNTVPFVAANNATYASDDGLSQSATIQTLTTWLDNQLADAAKKQERVIIAMHIPPGLDAYKGHAMWESSASSAFNASVQKYHDSIVAILAAHTHYDEIRFMHDNIHPSSTLVLSTPGIDTSHGNNPGFKIFSLDNNYEINNAITFAGNKDLQFQEQYDFQTAYQSYCEKNSSLHACLDKLDSNHTFFAIMKKHYSLGNSDYSNWKGVEEARHIAD